MSQRAPMRSGLWVLWWLLLPSVRRHGGGNRAELVVFGDSVDLQRDALQAEVAAYIASRGS